MPFGLQLQDNLVKYERIIGPLTRKHSKCINPLKQTTGMNAFVLTSVKLKSVIYNFSQLTFQ